MEGRGSSAAWYKLLNSGVVVTEVVPPVPLVGMELRREQARTSAQVHRCRDCGLAPSESTGDLPVPLTGAYRGACEQVNNLTQDDTTSVAPIGAEGNTRSTPAQGFSIVGEAPGREEVEQGKPFVGKSGKLLRALVTEAGFDWTTQVARMNVVSCWPKADGRTRGPTDKEMLACRKNLDRQLEVASWPYVLLVGAHALKAFRSDLKITHVQGGVYVWRNCWVVMPILHPAAILRDRTLKKPTQISLSLWYRIITREVDWSTGWSRSCVRCGGAGTRYDPDMVCYCDMHYEKWGDKTWRVEREKWDPRSQVTVLF